MAKSKVTTVEEAIAKFCYDGMCVMLPGFVNVGVSETLIEGLIAAGIKDISVISNNTSVPHRGIGKLVDAGVIKAITCSHIGNNAVTVQKVVDGEPMGTIRSFSSSENRLIFSKVGRDARKSSQRIKSGLSKLDIPRLIELYNEHILTTKAGLFGFIAPMAMGAIPADKQPAACLDCGSCEQVCPQQIKISDVMEDFVKVLGG